MLKNANPKRKFSNLIGNSLLNGMCGMVRIFFWENRWEQTAELLLSAALCRWNKLLGGAESTAERHLRTDFPSFGSPCRGLACGEKNPASSSFSRYAVRRRRRLASQYTVHRPRIFGALLFAIFIIRQNLALRAFNMGFRCFRPGEAAAAPARMSTLLAHAEINAEFPKTGLGILMCH